MLAQIQNQYETVFEVTYFSQRAFEFQFLGVLFFFLFLSYLAIFFHRSPDKKESPWVMVVIAFLPVLIYGGGAIHVLANAYYYRNAIQQNECLVTEGKVDVIDEFYGKNPSKTFKIGDQQFRVGSRAAKMPAYDRVSRKGHLTQGADLRISTVGDAIVKIEKRRSE